MNKIPPSIDLSQYMSGTFESAKVREASSFKADLLHLLAPAIEERPPTMRSTKLCGRLEFRPGEVTVYAGYNGHRKSMWTGQVALDLCDSGQRVLLVSLEMMPARTLTRMLRQASVTAKPSKEDIDIFTRWTDSRLWIFDHMGRISPETCLAVCRYFASELKGNHVVIDSMMMVCASEESLDEQKQFTTDLVRMSQETGLHVHLVAHCRKPQTGEEKRPSKYDLRGSAAISDQAHNVLTVWANKDKARKLKQNAYDEAALNEPDAVVSVEKQRNGEFEGALKLWWHAPSMRFCDDRLSSVMPYGFLTHA